MAADKAMGVTGTADTVLLLSYTVRKTVNVLRQLVSREPTSADTYSTGVVLSHLPPPSPPPRELHATKCCSVTLQTIHIKTVTLKFWGSQTSGYMLVSEQC